MNLPRALGITLRDLIELLDLPEVDVAGALLSLRRAVEFAVPTCVGLSMTLLLDGHRVTLNSIDDKDGLPDIASTLRMPLEQTADVATGSELVLYASTPGAFVDLAADFRSALGLDREVRLDEDGPAPSPSGISGVVELSLINRAVGILIGRGHTEQAAREQLHGQARKNSMPVFQVAAQLISATE